MAGMKGRLAIGSSRPFSDGRLFSIPEEIPPSCGWYSKKFSFIGAFDVKRVLVVGTSPPVFVASCGRDSPIRSSRCGAVRSSAEKGMSAYWLFD